ncbi:HU family DNA-binding protein [Clostridium botulinum]|uniref:HU family DNA-binding protein n=1 Tax=Clostridium botulinum TaxID=1491 RepID=UPI000772E2C0|nr:HU family DNA-binding protein [Clostridium botulinum]
MNKKQLLEKMSEKSGLTQKDAEKALKAFMESIEETLVNGEKVQLVKFGTFETRQRAERVGRNPQTKEEITIPASVAPAFKFAKDVKEKVKEAHK